MKKDLPSLPQPLRSITGGLCRHVFLNETAGKTLDSESKGVKKRQTQRQTASPTGRVTPNRLRISLSYRIHFNDDEPVQTPLFLIKHTLNLFFDILTLDLFSQIRLGIVVPNILS